MSLPIDKGIPVPEWKYPWKTMEVGDSFFVEANAGEKLRKLQKRITASCTWQRRRYGRRHTIRQVDGGCRAWRIE